MADGSVYVARIVDEEIAELLEGGVRALAIEGAKGVGKTATARRRAATVHELDDPDVYAVAAAGPRRVLEGPYPVLIDEWQRLPTSWDLVRRAVDDPTSSGIYLLTGSASPRLAAAETGNERPVRPPTHSGALRIVTVRMRPLTLVERGVGRGTVSLRALLDGSRPDVDGQTDVGLADYVSEIVSSGFPGVRLAELSERVVRSQLDSALHRIVDHDFEELGRAVRNPSALRRWMAAYAAASSTTASYETIRDAATAGEGEKPAKTTTRPYRDILERLWIVDPVPGWLPTLNRIARLSSTRKHQLVDPALAARLLGVGAEALLSGRSAGPPMPRDGTLLGALFESLITNDVRVYAQAAEAAEVAHLRTRAGEREIDLIVPRADGRVVAIEVKLKRTVDDRDLRHLHWLREQIGDDLLDAVIVTTGGAAYRRQDGIAVVPAALLGP